MELLVNVDVPDVARAVDFYRNSLGLTLVRHLFDGSVAEMACASARIFLLQKAGGEPATGASRPVRDYGRHWTPVHLDFVVEDVDAALRRARDAGAAVESGVRSHPWGRLALLADPFGNGFCLVELGERGYDAVETSG